MSRKLRPAAELVSDIGSLGFILQHHSDADIAEAVTFCRTVNPEMFNWLAKLLAATASPPTPDPMRECLEWIASQTNLFFAECSQAEEIIHRVKLALAASPPTPDALAQKLCLMSIRRWVDEAVAMHRRENGIATPTGLAGQIAAQVWLHVGDVLAHETPARCHCGCSRPAHTFWREGGIFTGCKVCACEAYEPKPASSLSDTGEPPT